MRAEQFPDRGGRDGRSLVAARPKKEPQRGALGFYGTAPGRKFAAAGPCAYESKLTGDCPAEYIFVTRPRATKGIDPLRVLPAVHDGAGRAMAGSAVAGRPYRRHDQVANCIADFGASDPCTGSTAGGGGDEEPMLPDVRNLFGELSGSSRTIASHVPAREMRTDGGGLHERCHRA
jgi:hypothetical protein